MRALVLCSGGVDSTTLLAMAVEKYGSDEVCALSISYGQRHEELKAAHAYVLIMGLRSDFWI